MGIMTGISNAVNSICNAVGTTFGALDVGASISNSYLENLRVKVDKSNHQDLTKFEISLQTEATEFALSQAKERSRLAKLAGNLVAAEKKDYDAIMSKFETPKSA